VIGNSHKHQLAEIALDEIASRRSAFVPLARLAGVNQTKAADRPPLFVSDIFAHTELLAAPVFETASGFLENNRTRPNLKVQDGCDNRCSFCVIPSVRGQSRSLPVLQVIDEVNALVAAGYREVVISGINLGRWGHDLVRLPISGVRKLNFEFLLRSILDETQLEKLRISSVEPMDWTDEVIALVASSPRIAKHAHVPLQSGSDAVLRRMHRKYRPWHYREKIEKIHAVMPTAAIGADVMVGFPGETDVEFESTRRLIADLPFTYLHVFTYSARPGTPAATMANQVPIHIARERNKILHDLAAEKKLAFMNSFVGEPLEAITLSSPTHYRSYRAKVADSADDSSSAVEEAGVVASVPFSEALTDNYQKLYLKGRHTPNRWITAHIDAVQDGAFVSGL
jgi:threonylcarbamoyladenosine tRNA methylthiotransferase MtaB